MSALVAASPAYAAAMAAIHEDAFSPAERWGAGAMALQLGLPGAFGWIDPAGGMVLARVAADEAEVLTLAVSASQRRRGLGRTLLDAAMRSAGRRGAAAMFLEVAERNEAALSLYLASGFAAVGKRPRYYPGGGAALVLRAAILCGSADA